MKTPQTIEDIRLLHRVDLAKGLYLPDRPGIYFVSEPTRVLYIGKAMSLRNRWAGGHHRALEMVLSGVPMELTWVESDNPSELDSVERELITLFQPSLNRVGIVSECKVRSMRLDDEVWAWLQALPGRSTNEGLRALIDASVFDRDAALQEILETLRNLARRDLAGEIEDAVGRALDRVPTADLNKLLSIPSLQRGARGLQRQDHSATDPSIDRSDEFVQG